MICKQVEISAYIVQMTIGVARLMELVSIAHFFEGADLVVDWLDLILSQTRNQGVLIWDHDRLELFRLNQRCNDGGIIFTGPRPLFSLLIRMWTFHCGIISLSFAYELLLPLICLGSVELCDMLLESWSSVPHLIPTILARKRLLVGSLVLDSTVCRAL